MSGLIIPRFNVDRAEVVEALTGGQLRTEDGLPQIRPRSWLYGSKEAEAAGFKTTRDFPDMLPDKADWKAIIEECHAEQRFPMYHRAASKLPQKPNQNGLGHCWNYGCTHSVEDRILVQFGVDKAIKLAPNSLAWLVNWKNKGYFLNETIVGAQERGIAPAADCKEYELNPKNFDPNWQEDALSYRIAADGVWDTTRSEGDEMMVKLCLAILRLGVPLYIAHNWWSHALEVTGLSWAEGEYLNIAWDHFNSHNDGHIQLTGTRGVPDEAYGIGSITLPKAA